MPSRRAFLLSIRCLHRSQSGERRARHGGVNGARIVEAFGESLQVINFAFPMPPL